MREAGYDPARLPPGQYLTEKWPVLHAGSVPHTDLATWDFRVWGEVETELTLGWKQFLELPTIEVSEGRRIWRVPIAVFARNSPARSKEKFSKSSMPRT